MFSYSPTTQDRSGEIMAMGQIGAAQTGAQSMSQLGSDIGGALASIGNMYGEIEGNKAKGRAFKDVFKVIAPSAGIDLKQLETLTGGSLKNDMDWYNARETMAPLLPSLINAQLTQDRIVQAPAIQTQRDTAATDRMYEAERLRRERETMNTPPASSGQAFTRGNVLRNLFQTARPAQPNNP